MKIKLVDKTQKENWNKFVSHSTMGNFLHTFEWSEFCEKIYGQVWRFMIEEKDKTVAVFFVYPQVLKIGAKILYCPRGPVIVDDALISKKEIFALLNSQIDILAREQSAWSFKVDIFSNESVFMDLLAENNFTKTRHDLQPRHTLILDLRVGIEEVLKNMHTKTRYNIRLAEKKGVEILVDNDRVDDFYSLVRKTMDRQKINLYSKKYFTELLKLPFAKLYLAKFEDKIISANIMIFWQDSAVYLYGASDYDYREIMAPYLLQFSAMQEALQNKNWFFDFWGAAPKNSIGREQNWSGFTRFKMGFSPDAEITEYLGTYEKVFEPVKYGLYNFVRKIFRG
ncbi:MAG: peptidoglycan bridge formation glycyltransferase FemA/FemB family protein [Patescibacteria group bacterium]